MTLSYLVGRRNGHTSPWTEAMVARLKELWAQGYSAAEISNELGHISRCGVITKAHRLNLAARKPGRRKRARKQ
jgi:GcrA cell cycle regulator